MRVDELTFAPGVAYGLIGPNGCGKTTLLKLIAGLLTPDGGIIDREGLTGRDITMAPRKPYFLHDTVYRNLTYPLSLRGIKPDKVMLDYYLELADLSDKQKQYAPSLSSGEQQKLSLIRAMIFSPKFILIDEALSNLDMESSMLFEREILERQARAPVTYVICSHQLSHIQRLCGYVYFMWGGRIEAGGPAHDVLLRSDNPNLRKYMQYASMQNG